MIGSSAKSILHVILLQSSLMVHPSSRVLREPALQIASTEKKTRPVYRVRDIRKILYSHVASLHPGVYMGTGEFNAGGNPAMDYIPSYPGWSRNTPDRFMLWNQEVSASLIRGSIIVWRFGGLAV